MVNEYIGSLIPRVIREANWPRARFLSEDEQARYEEKVKSFNSQKARNSLNVPIKGSNLFKIILLNQMGRRTATLSEIWDISAQNPNPLKGFYKDLLSVVLRSAGDSSCNSNNYLAVSLAKPMRKKKFAHAFVLSGLELKEDDSSDYGLILIPGKDFQYFEAPELDHENNQKRFLRLDERGMPIFDNNGNKTLYTREDGLSRLCVDTYSYLGSVVSYLSNSSSYGRVVCVDAEGVAPKNLEEHLTIV